LTLRVRSKIPGNARPEKLQPPLIGGFAFRYIGRS